MTCIYVGIGAVVLGFGLVIYAIMAACGRADDYDEQTKGIRRS